MSLYNKGSIISSNLIYRPNQGSQVRVLSSRPYDLVGKMGKSPHSRGVCNMQNLTVRRNSVANCQRLDSKISTGLEVVAIPIDECRFESCLGHKRLLWCCRTLKGINIGVEGNFNG